MTARLTERYNVSSATPTGEAKNIIHQNEQQSDSSWYFFM